MAEREWVLLNPGPANMGTLTPRDMEGVIAAFAAVLDELGVAAVRGAR